MERSISVALLPTLLSPTADLSGTCSIVIDVLRATSVMATAGRSGARRITTCENIDQAFAMADTVSERPLLCGERQCRPIAGFDLGNSPAEYTAETVTGRDMILTTTNGTRAIKRVLESRRLLVSSFLNLEATVAAVSQESRLQIVCAGTEGNVSTEDVLLAGAIIDRLDPQATQDKIDDSARLAWCAWKQSEPPIRPLRLTLRDSLGGRNLIGVGYETDIDRCAEWNTIHGIVQRVEPHRPVFSYLDGLSEP